MMERGTVRKGGKGEGGKEILRVEHTDTQLNIERDL